MSLALLNIMTFCAGPGKLVSLSFVLPLRLALVVVISPALKEKETQGIGLMNCVKVLYSC